MKFTLFWMSVFLSISILSIKEEVIKIRRSVRIKLPDSIILATSHYLNVPVISSDSDFGRVEEANVIYYEKE